MKKTIFLSLAIFSLITCKHKPIRNFIDVTPDEIEELTLKLSQAKPISILRVQPKDSNTATFIDIPYEGKLDRPLEVVFEPGDSPPARAIVLHIFSCVNNEIVRQQDITIKSDFNIHYTITLTCDRKFKVQPGLRVE